MTNPIADILSESAREFDELFPRQKYKDRPDESTAAFIQADADVLKSFLLSKQRAVIEAIIAECEGMDKKHTSVDIVSKWYYLKEGYNEALTDLILLLKESLTTTP